MMTSKHKNIYLLIEFYIIKSVLMIFTLNKFKLRIYIIVLIVYNFKIIWKFYLLETVFIYKKKKKKKIKIFVEIF